MPQRGATRGNLRARSLPYDPRDIAEGPELLPDGHLRPAPTQRPGNPALVFSAAQQDQEATESEPTAAQPEAHGAFTAALLEALQTLPADAPASLVYQRVKAVLEGSSAAGQEPDLDATAARRRQPLFASPGGAGAGASGNGETPGPGKVRTAALRSDSAGNVWLDIGRVSGIGIGSEFTSMSKTDADSKRVGESIQLRVNSLQGIARSTATIVSPAGANMAAAKVQPGEVFELTKWVPPESAPLLFWLGPANLSEAEILAAAAQLKLAGVTSVSDPAEQPWTDLLFWDGNRWLLQHAAEAAVARPPAAGAVLRLDPKAAAAPVVLGPTLTATALRQYLPIGAKLWVNLPPSRELALKLSLHQSNSAVQAAPDLADANYLLTGALTGDAPSYAWLRQQEFAAGPRLQPGAHSPGCSATSPYPVRTDWVSLADLSALDAAATSLNQYASLLAKLHGWLQLADTPSGASTGGYYKLAILHASDQTPLLPGEPALQDDRLRLALQSTADVTTRRWVYVLDIDCHGKGSLLYPRDATGNQFPSDADSAREFILPGSPTLRIGPPFGVDTLLMLSTAEPLPDPYALEFEGVATRGSAGPDSPLARLLTGTSRATRGSPAVIPTDWGLDLFTLRSIPTDAPK